MKTPELGSLAWERIGGPPLTLGQKASVLAGAGLVLARDLWPKLRLRLQRWKLTAPRSPPKVDLAAWEPPQTEAVREAERLSHDLSSGPMHLHAMRTYWFSAVMCELTGEAAQIDREALFVAAALHDVGLFDPARPVGVHCFSVASSAVARRVMRKNGWPDDRQNRVAVAITSNLNPSVPAERFGREAHFMSVGGTVEVLAQQWKVHPDNAAEILRRFPRDDFASDGLQHTGREAKLYPHGRFACLDPIFPFVVRRAVFR